MILKIYEPVAKGPEMIRQYPDRIFHHDDLIIYMFKFLVC